MHPLAQAFKFLLEHAKTLSPQHADEVDGYLSAIEKENETLSAAQHKSPDILVEESPK